MSPDRKRRPRPPTSSKAQPLRRRAHEIVDRLLDTVMSDEEQVRLARVVLRSGSRKAINELFWYFQRCEAQTRWGTDNPLHEIAGALRVQAIKALKGPPGKTGENHRSALCVLWLVGRPGDIPLLTTLLEAQVLGDVDDDLWMALQSVVAGCDASDPRLIAALARVVEHSPSLSEVRGAANVLGDYRVPEAETSLARALSAPDPWRRAHVMTTLIFRSRGPYREAGEALLRELQQLAHDPEDWGKAAIVRALVDALGEDETASEQDKLPVVPEARLDEFDRMPDEACGAFLDRLGQEFALDQALLLRRLSAASSTRRCALLRALRGTATGGTPFFHEVWPLTSDPDEEVAALAIAACGATRSDQARMRLTTCLKHAIASEDVAAARPLLRGLRGWVYDGALWVAALSLPCETARTLAIEGLEDDCHVRGPAMGLLREAARREANDALRKRMDRLLERVSPSTR